MIRTYLKVRIPSKALSYLGRRLAGWWLDHLMPQLAYSIQDLSEVAGNGLTGSVECVMDDSEPLVMAYNMKKHSNLLFHRGVDTILQQAPLSKPSD